MGPASRCSRGRRPCSFDSCCSPFRAAAPQGCVDRYRARYQQVAAHLPCAVFGSRDEVLDYLGFRHVTGVKQWEPEAKAQYTGSFTSGICQRRVTTCNRLIARLIGSRSDYVAKTTGIAPPARADMQGRRVARIARGRRSSLLARHAGGHIYRAITSYLNIDSLEEIKQAAVRTERLRDSATWMYHEQPALGRTQLGESHSMKLLAQAITQDEGIDALKRGETVEEAAAATVMLTTDDSGAPTVSGSAVGRRATVAPRHCHACHVGRSTS